MQVEGFMLLWQDNRRLRRLLLPMDLGLVGFWIYSVEYLSEHPAAKGSDGFEFLLVVPMTLIALCLSLPALLLLISHRTIQIGAWVTLASIVINAFIWIDILGGLRRGAFWPLW